MIDKLKQIGLNDKESKIYIYLIKSGDSIVSDISKATKINRSLLYTILDRLAEKGIVTYIIKNNIRFYRAAEPNKILNILQEKEKVFSKLIPTLLALKSPSLNKPIVEILEGKQGIKTILNDVVRQKKQWFAFNIPGKGPEIIGPSVHAFEKDRQKQKISLKVICVKTKQGIKRAKQFAKMKFTQVKLTHKEYESPASNWIYSDRVVIIFWYKEFPFAIRIIDKNLADSYKNHFNDVWKSAEKL